MNGYNANNQSYSQDRKYSINSAYSGSSLNVYSSQTKTKKKSRCPKGATYGEVGSCCGFECTKACALEA